MAVAATIWMSRSLSTSFSFPYVDESSVRLFCITFRPHDKVLLFPPSVQTAKLLRAVVEAYWGLDSHETAPDCYTLNLTGSPFLKHARRDSTINVKYLCCAVLDKFKEHGWDLICCSDLSCKTDLTSWYFARSAPKSPHRRQTVQHSGEEDGGSDSGSGSISSASDRRLSSAMGADPSLVCLSLSKTSKLQLINAPPVLQRVLRNVVRATYGPGLHSDAQRGKHYEIKLNGSPWETSNREQLTAACRMLSSVVAEFNARGYRLFGLVNFKETSDSIFFESQDPNLVGSSEGGDKFMMVIMDGTSVLRLIGVQPSTIQAVEQTIVQCWDGGMNGAPSVLDEHQGTPQQTDNDQDARLLHPHHMDGLVVDFMLKGSPWQARLSKIGRSRQFVSRLLDVLLSEGWTVISGLDISRGLNSKSALLFQSCAPTQSLRHACISPLGGQSLQLVNAPASLRRLVQAEFQKIITAEKTLSDCQSEAGFLDSIFEVKLAGGVHWDPHPEKDALEYVNTRKHMGALLQRLMEAGWRVVASADCGHYQEDTDVGEGIHSWFVIFAGRWSIEQTRRVSGASAGPDSPTAHSLMNVSSRMGRRASAYASTTAPIHKTSIGTGSPITRKHRR